MADDSTAVGDIRNSDTEGEAVCHITNEQAHDAAVIIDVSEAVGHGEGGSADTAADGAPVTIAHHAAVIIGILGNGMDGNIAAYTAVLYDAALT